MTTLTAAAGLTDERGKAVGTGFAGDHTYGLREGGKKQEVCIEIKPGKPLALLRVVLAKERDDLDTFMLKFRGWSAANDGESRRDAHVKKPHEAVVGQLAVLSLPTNTNPQQVHMAVNGMRESFFARRNVFRRKVGAVGEHVDAGWDRRHDR